MAVNFYNESSHDINVKWQAILEKPQLVKSIESGEDQLTIHYEDGTSEEIKVSTSGGSNGATSMVLSSREW